MDQFSILIDFHQENVYQIKTVLNNPALYSKIVLRCNRIKQDICKWLTKTFAKIFSVQWRLDPCWYR